MVVDGATPEAAELGAATLAAPAGAATTRISAASAARRGAVLRAEGLLFGTTADVRATTAALIAAQPLLGPLAADPSLRGVMTSLSTVLTGVAQRQRQAGRRRQADAALGRALDAVARRPAGDLLVERLFAGGGKLSRRAAASSSSSRCSTMPHLMPGEAAGDAIRAAAPRPRRARPPDRRGAARRRGVRQLRRMRARRRGHAGGDAAALWRRHALGADRAGDHARDARRAGRDHRARPGAVGRFNLISVAFIPLFVGLGVDFGIQLACASAPSGATAARQRRCGARRHGARPLAGAAAAAVALGFCAFLPTDYVGISELGIIAGLGMVVALLLGVTLLPALLVLLGPRGARRCRGWRCAPLDRWLLRHRRAVLWAFGVSMSRASPRCRSSSSISTRSTCATRTAQASLRSSI